MTKERFIVGGAAVRLPCAICTRWRDERHSESMGNRAAAD